MDALSALNRLNDIAFSYFVSQSFAAACRIGLFDKLEAGVDTVADLSQELRIGETGCIRLLAAMENLELVEKSDDRYSNTALGRYASSASGHTISLIQSDNFFYRMWEYLPDALRESSPRFEQAWGTSAKEIYQAIFSDPTRIAEFFGLMDSYNLPIGNEIAAKVDFSQSKSVLDVAGGSGSLLVQILRNHAALKGTVLDLSPVCEVAAQCIRDIDMDNRISVCAADMLVDDFPTGHDTILLSWILHNYADDKCKLLLDKCFKALPVGGKLIVSEKVLNDDRSGTRWGVMMSLQMLIACEPGAKERTRSEYAELLQQAGFRSLEFIELNAPRDVIVAVK